MVFPRSASLAFLPLLAACASAPSGSADTPPAKGASAAAAPDGSTPPTTAAATPPPAPKRSLVYPKTRSADVAETFFGVTVKDPYRWLEDASSPEVKAWVDAEDALARAELEKLPGREVLRQRMNALSYLESVSPPLERGAYAFYSRKAAGQEKRTVYVRKGEKGAERALLDAATLSSDGSVSLGIWVPSYDGKHVAYVVHPNNADAGVLRVRDVETGKDSAVDEIKGAEYGKPSWTPKGDGFYYVGVSTDPNVPAADLPGTSEVRFHKLGQKPAEDAVVLPKNGNPETELEAAVSPDGHFLIVHVLHGGDIAAIKVLDQRKKGAAWVDLVSGYEGSMSAFAHKDKIYLRTTEGAPRGKLWAIDPGKLARDQWKEVVPESKDGVLDSAAVVGGHLSLVYLRKAASEIEIWTTEGKKVRSVELPGIGTTGGLFDEPDKDKAYYYFTSFTYPGSIFETSVKTGASKLWYSVEAPVDPDPYTVEQVFYPSKDGTQVSMFVVRRKDAPKDGSTPFLLTGYGGFNIGRTPYFSAADYIWLRAGGGIALPNLRGGNEYGEEWHRAGMLAKKQNVFDDFIGAAEHLVKSGSTKPERLVIKGGSNGGLLVAATSVQRPDLFRAVVCAVPVIDMIRYPLWGDGKTWVSEYGSPKDESIFKALFAYSPYHNVKRGTAYPAVLMLAADADDRVAPLHAWKMTAAWQAAQAADRPILMRVERHAGHGGADMIKSRVEQAVDTLAFQLAQVGAAPPAK